ncbi:MAG: sodium-independent anion transporter [Halothiobacillus sp. 14-56-357]|jgi:SulP family sulfate permease|uniref:SulP family inorganic anion transporter n=1 Tax=Halothiobacillus sp. 15-55-196 TaxID=1970382 RepID=UPI000BCE02A7|nr:SulP family inorganic anion transporter [Halothiobacillus sp. 15-55-196]OZB37379.1 MAG: sodium-independent anion transporter [Halothiobacillus sp. 15-55-196]OZB57301.1 MAG: sodium-independent anion transporter [Halothiobacillus sp. 14-56-357]OZB79084.1 MAG: sodium-independent anion transporter [Halothiobacillus sp. 13-55-115]
MFHFFAKNTPANARQDVLSGLTVALALVPEALAFALIAHLNPLMGLYGAFIMVLASAIFGGRPGMISGATGATAVVIVGLVVTHGVEYLLAALILMGVIQILVGAFRLGKYIRIVPYPVFLGFVNGLAIVIFLAQLPHFKEKGADGQMHWIVGQPLWIMLGLVVLTMLISHFFPKITRAFPAALMAIIVTTLISIGLVNLSPVFDTKTVGDLATIAGGLPSFHIPDFPLTWDAFMTVLPFSVVLAGVGLIESLLTLQLVDDLTETRGQPNRECVAQGIGNATCGFFGGMGGCAMVGQTMINVESGGRGRLSGIAAGLFLVLFILFLSPLIEQIPIATLVGIMFMVVIGTFEWGSINLFGKVPKQDIFVGLLVAAVTVFTDLAVAVITGVIVSALMFAWEHAGDLKIESSIDENGVKVYRIKGPLFFASTAKFSEAFDFRGDPDDVYLDFAQSKVVDHSALEAIDSLADKYRSVNKTLHLRHLSPECRKLLKKAGDLVEVNIKEDPIYHVADELRP